MKINFSDYKSLTQNDMVNINPKGIEYFGGKVLFKECLLNFNEHHNMQSRYIGEYDVSGTYPSIALYTAPKTTHFFFMDDEKDFYQTLSTIKELGYELMNTDTIA